MDQRPSIIASAAILAALDATLTRKAMDLRLSLISSWGNVESVSLFRLHSTMLINCYLDKELKEIKE